MILEILSPVECRVKSALAAILRPSLCYTAVHYTNGPYRKIRREYQKSSMTKDDSGNYYFYTGFLPKVKQLCKEKNVPLEIVGEEEKLPIPELCPLKTIKLREEQLRLINKSFEKQRGVLQAPTGVGKTVLGMAIIGSFKKEKAIWLCHTKDLMYQAGEEIKKELGETVGYIGDSSLTTDKRITIATRQSFINVVEELGDLYDIVIIDECHHLTSFDGGYTSILSKLLAPVRIGLTATLSKSEEASLVVEGLLGPIIDQVTIKEGQERNIMANIKIKFLKIPVSYKIKEIRRYADVYKFGVVERAAQHEAIAKAVKPHTDKKESVLILVSIIQHGKNILKALTEIGVPAYMAQGSTESVVRNELKTALNNKNIHCLIATTIFKEGVNIPELDVIINASGGKSEIATLQAIGRGLRLTKTKKLLTVYDIFDPSNNYLISHFGERVCLYSELGWI